MLPFQESRLLKLSYEQEAIPFDPERLATINSTLQESTTLGKDTFNCERVCKDWLWFDCSNSFRNCSQRDSAGKFGKTLG
jgi:hypothetical protein